MEPQTESSTPLSLEPGTLDWIPERHADQPKFCLIAQDITAPLTIDFWIKVNQKVREHMDRGMTMMEAVKAVRVFYFLDQVDVPANDAKLAGACAIASQMEAWPNRKLAD